MHGLFDFHTTSVLHCQKFLGHAKMVSSSSLDCKGKGFLPMLHTFRLQYAMPTSMQAHKPLSEDITAVVSAPWHFGTRFDAKYCEISYGAMWYCFSKYSLLKFLACFSFTSFKGRLLCFSWIWVLKNGFWALWPIVLLPCFWKYCFPGSTKPATAGCWILYNGTHSSGAEGNRFYSDYSF